MKRVFVVLGMVLLLNLAVPAGLGLMLQNGGSFLDTAFGITVPPWLQERLGLYPFLVYRPEIFVGLAVSGGWPAFEVFLTTCAFTTFTTLVTWVTVGMGKRAVLAGTNTGVQNAIARIRERLAPLRIRLHAFREKFERPGLAWLLSLGERYGTALLFVIFAFPVLPGTDTAIVIAARLKQIPYSLALFIGINTVKTALIIGFMV
jgi:hypothetical protein